FSKLKGEWVHGKRYRTRQEARQDVFLYLEVFYNRKRRHAFLGYQSPEAFERQFHQTNQKLAA
ncbi:MAG: IS3 family transposase, partial [Pseudomonadota bacterium]